MGSAMREGNNGRATRASGVRTQGAPCLILPSISSQTLGRNAAEVGHKIF